MIRLIIDKTGISDLRMEGSIAEIMAKITGAVGIIWASMPEEARLSLKRILTKQFAEDGVVWSVLDCPGVMADVEKLKSRHTLFDRRDAEISPLAEKIAEALSKRREEQ